MAAIEGRRTQTPNVTPRTQLRATHCRPQEQQQPV